jgi:uncharacterized membrane protein
MPALAGEQYRHWSYSKLGTGPLSATLYVLRHPIASLELLFEPVTKVRVWLASFGSWLFLPLLSPLIIVALPDFLERFWNDGPDFWNFHMQYSMPAAPVLAFAAIDGAARLSGLWSKTDARVVGTRIALACVGITAVASIAINPLAEVSTYVPAATAAGIQSCLDVIPSGASVAGSQNVLPHLATRTHVYTIPAQVSDRVFVDPVKLGVDYLVIDVGTEGNDQLIRPVFVGALNSGYVVACSNGLTLVLSRTGGTGQALTPGLERWLAGQCAYRGCAKS